MTQKSRNTTSYKDESDEEASKAYEAGYPYDQRAHFFPYQQYSPYEASPVYYNQDYSPPIRQFSYAHAYPDVYSYSNPPYIPQAIQQKYAGMVGSRQCEKAPPVNDSEEEPEQGKKVGGKKKVSLKYIESKSKRGVTFSKRKKGIMKKAYELNVLTGTQILLLVASESGHVYTFATPKLKPIISEHEHLIQQCLNTPHSPGEDGYFGDYDCFLRDPTHRYEKRGGGGHLPCDFYSSKK